MTISIARCCASAGVLALGLALVAPAAAQSRQITTPNVTTEAGTQTVTLNGEVFANKGLIGVGRLDANTRDFAGETLGSFSGMALDLRSWRKNADGSYTGSMFTLPDRGPNDVGPFVGTTNYRNRVHTSLLTLRPYTGSAVLPQATSSQNQLTITPTGGFLLTDSTGTNFTGKDAGNVTPTNRNGALVPVVPSGEGAGRISLDSEAIAFRPDGSFYVSDEYAANIYYFNAAGRQLGALNTVNAILPKSAAGVVSFDGSVAPVTGRRNNQGLEALAVTPDNRRLVTILQSATVQDTNGSSQQTRNNTRILVYDISSSAVGNTNPIGHYVLQLPTLTSNGGGGAVNRTAAQSEMLALNNNQFLVLSRDGNGRGSGSANPLVFKSILLVDVAGATNLVDTAYEDGVTPIATNGTLVSGIVPAAQAELVNILNVTQLTKFGMNLSGNPSNITSVSEKWEAMGLAPVLDESAPQDFFLFVGNDNDFQASNGLINGQSYDASLTGAGGTGNNDSVMLVYRLSLPTYVDPLALEALNGSAPDVLYGTRIAANALAGSASQPAMRFLNGQRGLAAAPRAQLWVEGDWNRIGGGASPLTGLSAEWLGATVGVDVRVGSHVRIGAFGGYRDIDGRLSFGQPLKGDAWTVGGYAAVSLPAGFYLQGSAGVIRDLKFKEIGRASAYGQNALGFTTGDGWSASGELGWTLDYGKVAVTPFAAVDYSDVQLDGYQDHGASLSNLVFPDRDFQKLTASFGAEVSLDWGAVRPALRGGYAIEDERGDDSAVVSLASARHAMGTVALALADTERDSAFGEARLSMQQGPLSAFAAGKGRWGRGEDDYRVSVGVAYGF